MRRDGCWRGGGAKAEFDATGIGGGTPITSPAAWARRARSSNEADAERDDSAQRRWRNDANAL